MKTITPKDLVSLIKESTINLIDIREIDEHSAGHAKESINIPQGKLYSNPSHYINKTESYFLICQSGRRSNMLTTHLTQLGYDVTDVLEGHNNWPEDLI